MDQRVDVSLAVAQVAGLIGAEIGGIDLRAAIGPGTAHTLRTALARHLVLFFRDQFLDFAAQKRLTEAFGPLVRVPYIQHSDEDSDVIAVLKEADETKISVFGGDWHADFSFLSEPPAGSVLSAAEVPPFGGDTLWANQIAAYETLPRDLAAIAMERAAIHTGAPYGAARAPAPDLATSRSIGMRRGDPEADRETVHPLAPVHEGSGQRGLFVNPIYTTRTDGMTAEESRPILARLYAHATRPEFTCRFRWTPGAVAVWDNRATLHYAINDYDGQRRLLYRTTFGGPRPR